MIEVELTLLQKKYYKAIYERNMGFLRKGCKGSNVPSLINIMMELRKVCFRQLLYSLFSAAIIHT